MRRKMRYGPAIRKRDRRNAETGQRCETHRSAEGQCSRTGGLPRAQTWARPLTVQERIARLERARVIKGYTVKLGNEAQSAKLRAVVMISADAKQADRITTELKRMPEVHSLLAVSGTFDMMATVEADTPARMDSALDRIRKAHGVARTVSSIVLSEKFSR